MMQTRGFKDVLLGDIRLVGRVFSRGSKRSDNQPPVRTLMDADLDVWDVPRFISSWVIPGVIVALLVRLLQKALGGHTGGFFDEESLTSWLSGIAAGSVWTMVVGIAKTVDLREKATKFKEEVASLYPRSYPIVHDGIIEKMKRNSEKSKGDAAQENEHKEYDKHVTPPLQYCKKVIDKALKPPPFDPDAAYINCLFAPETKCVIAVTGVDPAMWLDPAFSFYLMNNGLAALVADMNRMLTTNYARATTAPCERCTDPTQLFRFLDTWTPDNQHVGEFESAKQAFIVKLGRAALDFGEAGFCVARFFILDPEHIKDYQDDYLASLYALHDMFRMRAYFVKKNRLDELLGERGRQQYADYNGYIWKRFYAKHTELSRRAVQDGMVTLLGDGVEIAQPHAPEFLVLPNARSQIRNGRTEMVSVVHTYRYGAPWTIDDEWEVGQKALDLIRDIARICAIHWDDDSLLYRPSTPRRNGKHSLIVIPPQPQANDVAVPTPS